MDAGYVLPLPSSEIAERLNHRQRIPLSPWSLKVTSVGLVERPERPPLVELTVEVTEATASTFERWAVHFPVERRTLQAVAPFLLLLKVHLEDWWLNRHRHPDHPRDPQSHGSRLDGVPGPPTSSI